MDDVSTRPDCPLGPRPYAIGSPPLSSSLLTSPARSTSPSPPLSLSLDDNVLSGLLPLLSLGLWTHAVGSLKYLMSSADTRSTQTWGRSAGNIGLSWSRGRATHDATLQYMRMTRVRPQGIRQRYITPSSAWAPCDVRLQRMPTGARHKASLAQREQGRRYSSPAPQARTAIAGVLLSRVGIFLAMVL